MPTYNRRPFIAHAIAYFQRQTYENRELIILDDGEDPVSDLVPDDPAIRYLHAPRFPNLGTKRNAACEAARGDFLLHWDDDDWYAPHRIAAQVEALIGSDAEISGIDHVYFLEPKSQAAWQYVYPRGGPPWVCGATLSFRRSYWRAHPFTGLTIGEDTIFAAAADGARMRVLPDNGIFVGLIHDANTCRRQTEQAAWRRTSPEEIRFLMGRDWANYVDALSAREIVASGAGMGRAGRVSVVIPHGGAERLPHLATCLANLAQARGVSDITVVDMSPAPSALETARLWRAKHVFTRSEGPFDRARALNIGAALAIGEFVLWLDNDLVFRPDFVERAVGELGRRGLDFLLPYSVIDYLSPTDSEGVREGALDPAACRPLLSLAPERMVSGGAGLVRTEFLRRYGGIPEGFRGWGGEDNAWVHKAALLGASATSADPRQRMWHLHHPTSGAHDPAVHRKNPHYADNLRLLESLSAVRDRRQYLERFPPQPPSCAWDRAKTIVLLGLSTGEGAARCAEGLKALLGLEVCLLGADADLAAQLRARKPDALVAFGVRDLSLATDLEDRTIVVLDDAAAAATVDPARVAACLAPRGNAENWPAQETALFDLEGSTADARTLASALAQPLSFVLNGGPAPAGKARVLSRAPVGSGLPVWTYWEGECPAWIVACRATIAAHAPVFRSLDRQTFEVLRDGDQDIDIDRLEVAHRADYVRAYLLARYGGLWLDSDCIAMKPLAPLLDWLRADDFLAHRDRQGYFPNGLIGAKQDSVIAAEFYRQVCSILRSGARLGWISLGGEPLTKLLTATKVPFRELACERIQPICWSQPGAFFAVASEVEHEQRLDAEAFCYMMSNTEVRKLGSRMPDQELTTPGTFFSFLIERSARNAGAKQPAPAARPAERGAQARLGAEALSFFLECYAELAPERVLEVAHRLGRWGVMVQTAEDGDGLELHGVECSAERRISDDLLTGYKSIVRSDRTAPLASAPAGWDLVVVSDPLRNWPGHAAKLAASASEIAKRVLVWNWGPAEDEAVRMPIDGCAVTKRRVANAGGLRMEAQLLTRDATRAAPSTSQVVFETIYRGNLAAGAESASGPGSSLGQTEFLRRSLPLLLQSLGARSVVDAACGDFNWMRHVRLGVQSYVGVDIVPAIVERNQALFGAANRSFVVADVTRQVLPHADLILCRDCLVHFSFEDIWLALGNFVRSGTAYLLATNFGVQRANAAIDTGDWRPLNFLAEPFRFPPPVRALIEGCTEMGGCYADKGLSLWRLKDIAVLLR
jgi:glycosyltransferase involved in cell wall biosynthesis